MRHLTLAVAALAVPLTCFANEYIVTSPSGINEIEIAIGKDIRYRVIHNDIELIKASPISLTIDGAVLGLHPELITLRNKSTTDLIRPVIKEKRKEVTDSYNELYLTFRGDFSVVFRAYDDGVAYRFVLAVDSDVRVDAEQACFNFAKDSRVYFPALEGKDDFHTSYEVLYKLIDLSEISDGDVAVLPILVAPDEGPKVAITEADLEDYPGMYLTGSTDEPLQLEAVFPAYPVEEKVTDGVFPERLVVERADYLAQTKGTRSFPWRVIVIADKDGDLIETDIVYRLAGRQRIEDTSWIKPGKSTSEWLIDNNIYGVDFRAGYNTDTYKYYIDFCAEFGVEYVLFDAGWSDVKDLFKTTPAMDMDFLTSYAKEKGVGVILWTCAETLDRQMTEALDKFGAWGVKGIMVDFMNRDDQKMVNFYYRVAAECARRHMIVDFHGAYKPTGLRREYPNVMTQEGFIAFEYNKWSDILTPEHEMQMAFIRLIAGPMDYEPGCMKNAQKEHFRPINTIPHSQGTRMHQIAMFVVYESPYAKMGGNPADYRREPELTRFIAGIPTVWDETKVLDAKVADYVVIMRRAANGDYYLGAMTDWSPRTLDVDLPLLDEGDYAIEIYQDGINADRYAEDFKHSVGPLDGKEKLRIRLAPGGGYVARIYRK